MELIFVLFMVKFYCIFNDKELIKWDCEYVKLLGIVEKYRGFVILDLVILIKGKKVKYNYIE